MTWVTLSWTIFLHGVLFSTAAGSIGLNYRKNGVINAGLAGLMYFGSVVSRSFARVLSVNPYWSIPVCILFGGFVNLVLNIGYLDLLRSKQSTKIISVVSLGVFLGLYLLERGLWWIFLNQSGNRVMQIFLRTYDFTLFTAPGVLIAGVAALIFSVLLLLVLSPVVDDDSRGFDLWHVAIYSLSGAFACLVGALYPFWFIGTWQIQLIIPLAGVFLGGLEKRLNPFLGGFFAASITVWVTSLGRDVVGIWVIENPYVIALVLLLISAPLYPRGIIGSFRRIVQYSY